MRRTLAELGVPGAKVVPNPVDLERFQPGPPHGGSEVVVTHLSNLKDLKRAGDLVQAAEIALARDDRLRSRSSGTAPAAATSRRPVRRAASITASAFRAGSTTPACRS